MVDTVIRDNEIVLNGVFYPVTRPVQSSLASVYPGKVVFGDTNKDSNPNASVLAFSDQRGGIGVEVMQGEAQVDRAWYSTANLRYNNHLILPPLSTATAASGVSGVIHIPVVIPFADEIYAVYGSDVRKYNNQIDSWGSQLHDLPESATDAIVVRLDGTTYLIIAHNNGYTYFDGATWTDDTENVQFLAIWDDRLWGISSTGQLRFSTAIGTWIDDAQLPLPNNSVTDLMLGRDAAGNVIIYAPTSVGLFAHDIANARFIETEVGLPLHPENGRGSTKWRDAMYMPAGLATYKYQTGSGGATITLVGPDKDDGLPSSRQGTIELMVGSHNELHALVNATSATAFSTGSITSLDIFASRPGFRSQVVVPDTGRSMILSWNEIGGWMVSFESADGTHPATAAVVASAYGKYRLWFAQNQRVHYIDLPPNIINPQQVSDYEYGPAALHDYPWFTAGQDEVTKVAVRVKVNVKGAGATETVIVSYATDYVESYTAFSTITSDGNTTFELPNSSTPTGVEFKAWRFRVALARGSTTTLTPDMISLSLEYYKKLDAKWLHQVEINIAEGYHGQSAREMRANLITAIESKTLVHYTHRDSGANTNADFYVQVRSATGLEQTGHDDRGRSILTLVEV